jgi:putative oxidoreductase
MKSEHFRPLTFLLSHDIPIAHVGGGFMMAIGLWTRTAILANIPVLFGAVFFVYIEQGLFTQNQGLEFTALILFLLCMLLIRGPGRWSVDAYLEQAQPE